MTLTQTGSSVEGTYSFESGKVNGTVSGNVLSGRWGGGTDRDRIMTGEPFEFTMSADVGESFTGTWGHDDTGPDPALPGPDGDCRARRLHRKTGRRRPPSAGCAVSAQTEPFMLECFIADAEQGPA